MPQKSIREIGGQPLVSRAIAKLNRVQAVADTVLYCSTEEVQRYIDKDLRYNFVKRDAALDGDLTTFNEVLGSVIDRLETEYIVFLSCTSPFIRSETIGDMIAHIESGGFDSAFTARRLQSFCWFRGDPLNYDPAGVPRTQDLEPVWEETSALYIFSKKLFQEHGRRIGFKPYIKTVDIFEGWDIDTPADLAMAELIAERMEP